MLPTKIVKIAMRLGFALVAKMELTCTWAIVTKRLLIATFGDWFQLGVRANQKLEVHALRTVALARLIQYNRATHQKILAAAWLRKCLDRMKSTA